MEFSSVAQKPSRVRCFANPHCFGSTLSLRVKGQSHTGLMAIAYDVETSCECNQRKWVQDFPFFLLSVGARQFQPIVLVRRRPFAFSKDYELQRWDRLGEIWEVFRDRTRRKGIEAAVRQKVCSFRNQSCRPPALATSRLRCEDEQGYVRRRTQSG